MKTMRARRSMILVIDVASTKKLKKGALTMGGQLTKNAKRTAFLEKDGRLLVFCEYENRPHRNRDRQRIGGRAGVYHTETAPQAVYDCWLPGVR